MPHFDAEELEKQASGWTMTYEGFVVIKQADRFEAVRIAIERGQTNLPIRIFRPASQGGTLLEARLER